MQPIDHTPVLVPTELLNQYNAACRAVDATDPSADSFPYKKVGTERAAALKERLVAGIKLLNAMEVRHA